MLCKKCGEELLADAKFCVKCGEKVEDIIEQEEITSDKKVLKNRGLFFGILLLLVVVIAVVAIAFIKKERPVDVTSLISAEIGDTISFGSYEQDNNTRNGSEDIEWIVLDKTDDKVLVVSKNLLDVVVYFDSGTNNTWDTSACRSWLNTDFANKAFSKEEQECIISTVVKAEKSVEANNLYAGKDTLDKIFILSRNEMEKYFPQNDSRICFPTQYTETKFNVLKEQGMTSYYGDDVYEYGMRVPGQHDYYMQVVDQDGNFDYIVSDGQYFSIRPAMWLGVAEPEELLEDDYSVGVTYGMGGVDWIIIDRDDNKALLLAKDIIGHEKYALTAKCDSWEDSYLRQWLYDFMITNFSSEERAVVAESEINESGNINDKLFLLSSEELMAYENLFKYACQLDSPEEEFWMRDSLGWLCVGAYSEDYCTFSMENRYANEEWGVRPAMWIYTDDNTSNFVVHDETDYTSDRTAGDADYESSKSFYEGKLQVTDFIFYKGMTLNDFIFMYSDTDQNIPSFRYEAFGGTNDSAGGFGDLVNRADQYVDAWSCSINMYINETKVVVRFTTYGDGVLDSSVKKMGDLLIESVRVYNIKDTYVTINDLNYSNIIVNDSNDLIQQLQAQYPDVFKEVDEYFSDGEPYRVSVSDDASVWPGKHVVLNGNDGQYHLNELDVRFKY